MFNWTLRTKLPELDDYQSNAYNEGVRGRDAYSKYRNKMYVDETRESELESSKKSMKEKIDTQYHPEPF